MTKNIDNQTRFIHLSKLKHFTLYFFTFLIVKCKEIQGKINHLSKEYNYN